MDKNGDKMALKEIRDMKKLLILHLLKSGASSREIRAFLKLSGKAIKKLVPNKKIKKYEQTKKRRK